MEPTIMEALLQFFLAASIIFFAGTQLTRFADAIASVTKLGRLLVGSLLLAGATSLPELMVDISAVRKGMYDLAVGDLMGSCLFNLLILAVFDLFNRSTGKVFSKSSTAHALSGALSITLAALAALAIFLGPQLSAIEIGSLGLGSMAIMTAYVLGLRVVFFDQKITAELALTPPDLAAAHSPKLSKAFAGFSMMAAIILIAAPFLAEAAAQLADRSGLGRTFIGTTLVALSTSLPELVTTREAVKRKAYDLAVGNIFGSNCFNMAILVVLDFVVSGPMLSLVSATHALTAISIVLVTAVAIMSQLYQAEKRVLLLEPDAVLIILMIIASLGLVYWAG